MFTTLFQKISLAIAGTTALAIGVFILVAPHAFYASYGLAPGDDPSMLSELRAPAANLAAMGAIILTGIVRPGFARVSAVVALTVFLAFPVGRIVGLLLDGMPSGGILGALAIELAIGVVCLAAFRPWPKSGFNSDPHYSIPGARPSARP